MQGLLIVLAIIVATILGGCLALVRYDHILLGRRLDDLQHRVARLERTRGGAYPSRSADTHARTRASAQMRRPAEQEDSR